MPSEISKSAESVSESIVEHLKGGAENTDWIKWVALSAMIMALFSAIGALLAGITANDSLMERTEEVLEVSRMANDELHVEVLRTKHEVLKSLGKVPDVSELVRIEMYESEANALQLAAEKKEALVVVSAYKHEIFALGVTLLAIAIALSGMAIVGGRKGIWHVGIVFGFLGCVTVGFGVVQYF